MQKSVKERQSNFELLRIVSMLFVVIGHFIVRSIIDIPNGAEMASDRMTEMGGVIIIAIYSLVCVAVNLFILISGYWGIRFSIQSVLRLYLLCVCYNLLALGVDYYHDGVILFNDILKALTITKTANWFFPAYLWLLFLAPLCNSTINNVEIKNLRIYVLLFSILNILSGYILGYENPAGYGVMQLLLMYIIGGWIRRDLIFQEKRNAYIIIYIVSSLINFLIAYALVFYMNKNGILLFYYNTPLVIVSSIALFQVFRHMKFQSIAINKIAKTVVAVLLIQDIVLLPLMVSDLKEAMSISLSLYLLHCFGWTILFFCLAFFIETIRINIVERPLLRLMDLIPNSLKVKF